MTNLSEKPPQWEEETIADRISHCISMLYIHGYIPRFAMLRARGKLERELAKEAAFSRGHGNGLSVTSDIN